MSNKITLKSQSPYFDDFDPAKDYVQVLFRPGYPVQARELTTLQSFLQEQISNLGDHFFKRGTPIKNAEITFNTDVFEMVLSGDGNTRYPASGANSNAVLSLITNLENQTITNASGTVKAIVLPSPTGVDTTKFVGNIYIKYLTAERFDSDGGYIYATSADNPSSVQMRWNSFSQTTPACVVSSTAGTFFADGYIIQSPEQSIVVSNSTHTPSANIGFYLNEAIVTQDDDVSLYDNARGSTNEGAPGAHRLKYNITLGSRSLDASVSTNFYRIATYKNGVKQEQDKEVTKEIARITEILARRTNDESGSYTVTAFTQTVSPGDSDDDFVINVSPGKAYVKGYEIDRSSPTRISLVRGLTNTKRQSNFKVPVVGTTSVELTNIVGTLPGSQTGTALDSASRIQLRDGSNNVIGVARAWAIKDSVYKGQLKYNLYLYDIRMFTVITTTDSDFTTNLVTGNDVVSNKTRGYVYTTEGAAGITNGVAIISTTGKLRTGQPIESIASGASSTIASVNSFSLTNVTNITAAGGFSANLTSNSIKNENSSLVVELDRHISTYKDGTTNILDNDYNVLENTGGAATNINAANGFYDSVRVDDEAEITKTLKFGFIKIANDSDSTAVNYGWSAFDKEISLFYPDVHRVYQINETTDNTFETGGFTEISISTSGVLPVGTILTGKTSGSKAIVALQNSISLGTSSLASNNAYHMTKTGTGSASKLQVIMTKGQTFTANEQLEAKVPASTPSDYTYPITYTEATAQKGVDITSNFFLDNGQRAEYYDIGRLVRKDNTPPPNKEIVVFFSYFEADTSTSHYYSADSYAAENFITVDPRYYITIQDIKPKLDDKGVDLRNVLDFRLRVKKNTDITKSPFNFENRDFEDQDRIVPDSIFTTDFYEYLGRTDLISLQKNGNFKVISGIPSSNPKEPNISQDGMAIFYVSIPPAVRYPDYEIAIKKVDNRRYTMRDIGEIDRKLNMLQEQVTLSLLESQALHDNNDGKTKSGFVVDDFSLEKDNPQSPGDENHPEYRASIDTIERVMIPAQTPGIPVKMNLSNTLNMSTFFTNYLLRSFTEEAFSTQLNASTSQKINPFATWTFDGSIDLTPDEDNWIIRTDNYFTSLYGELKPFEGNAAAFQSFNRITTSSPGGRSTTTKEWIGAPADRVDRSAPHSVPDPAWGGFLRQAVTTTRTQAFRSTTSIKFNEPRATGEITSTLTDRKLIENPNDYWMRSVTITYTAENLKPNTTHTLFFGGKQISTGHVTNSDGNLTGTFTVPAQTFKAGKQNVELKDTKTTGIESFGVATFKSTGHIDTYDTVSTTVTETVKKTEGVESRVVSRQFQDPIAQMFTLPMFGENLEKETSILTSVDLWFSNVDTRKAMNKVKIEIRESVNGYPGGPDKIIGESAYLTIDAGKQTTVINNNSAVNFKFKKPIILRGATEYALVVKSPSDTMSVWVAEMGQELTDGSGIHSSQPNVGGYYGSFFVSQNASTWTAEQSKDMTYRLNRAKFDQTVDSSVTLVNDNSDAGYHLGDIGAYNQGLALETFLNSYYVRVHHPNHGMHYNNAQVTISGIAQGTYNGITDSDLNGTHTVYLPTLDTYLIKTNTRASRTGRVNTGIWTTFATQDIVYDSLTTNLMAIKDEADVLNVTLNTVTTAPINFTVSNNKIVNQSIVTPFADTAVEYELDRIVEFEDPKIIRSTTNNSGNDLTMKIGFISGTEYTSPIIKTGDNINPLVFRNLTGNLLTDSDIEGLTTRVITDSDNDDTLLEYASYTQAVQTELEHSAYVTNQVELEIPADGFNIVFEADMAPSSSIEAAYKIREPGDSTPFDELEWQDFPYAQQITEDNYGAFSSKSDYKQYRMKVETNFEFSSYKIRLRMRTENEALIPKIRALRIIADI